MAESKRPAINIDDAEHIRRFSAQIRSSSGHQPFTSRGEQPIVNGAAPVPPTIDISPPNEIPLGTGHSNSMNGNALNSTTASSVSHGTETPDLTPHHIWNQGDRLARLPRAVQQTILESPQLTGIHAPHPTPESLKPSPLTGMQDSPELSQADIGRMLVNEVIASLPRSGGIEDSIWAKPRSRSSRAPISANKDRELIGLSGSQLRKTDKEEAEARERAKEHNESFERMSFKIAGTTSERPFFTTAKSENDCLVSDAPNWASGTTTTTSIFTVGTAVTAKQPSEILKSPSIHRTLFTPYTEYRSVGTQTLDDDFVKVPIISPNTQQSERRRSSDAWVKIDSLLDTSVGSPVLEATATDNLLKPESMKVLEPESVKESIVNGVTNLAIAPAVTKGAVDVPTADPSKGEHAPASSSSPTKAAAPTKKGASADSILAAGLKFAKSRQNAYGAPKIASAPVKMRQAPPLQKPVEPAIASVNVTTEDNEINTANKVPLVPSDQSRSDLTPSSTVFAFALPATIAAANIVTTRKETREEAATGVDLENAMYFPSWGKPEEREGGAAQKRKLIIFGDPAWESAPTPSFIAELVFGGPLEDIRCLDSKAEVTFLDGADAQKFFDATPNGILFRKDTSGSRYAEVKFVEDVTPMSSLVKQHLENGATRCVRATGVDEDWSVEGLKALAGGKSNRSGQPMRRVESVEIGVNARNLRQAIFRFCDIRDAVIFKAEMARDDEWETINMQYTTDPCAEATSSRVMLKVAAAKAL